MRFLWNQGVLLSGNLHFFQILTFQIIVREQIVNKKPFWILKQTLCQFYLENPSFSTITQV